MSELYVVCMWVFSCYISLLPHIITPGIALQYTYDGYKTFNYKTLNIRVPSIREAPLEDPCLRFIYTPVNL